MSVFRLTFLHVDAQLFQHYLLKKVFLLHFVDFALLSNNEDFIRQRGHLHELA